MKTVPKGELNKEAKRKLLFTELIKRGASTANEIIDIQFNRDVRKGPDFVIQRGWRFYVHLNKHFADFEDEGLAYVRGKTKGPTGKDEKIWVPTKKGLIAFGVSEVKKGRIKTLVKNSLLKYRLNRKKGKS